MKKLIGVLAAALFIQPFSAFASVQSADITKIYVSPNGSDNGSGTIESPYKTPHKAKEQIRKLKKENAIASGGVVVYFRGGEYPISNTLELDKEDSGAEGAPIVYRAYPGEKVDFVGGSSVDSSVFKPVTDDRALKRIGDGNLAKNILCASLSDVGIDEMPEIKLRGSYSYSVSEFLEYYGFGKEAPPVSPEIFINGEAMNLARYPNEENLSIAQVLNEGVAGAWWLDSRKNQSDYVKPEDRSKEKATPFTFIPNDTSHVKKWASATDALIYGKFRYLWADQTVPLGTVDTEKNTVTSLWPSVYSVSEGAPFYIYNLLEELDIPGEYYIDRDEKMIYIYPPKSVNGKFPAVRQGLKNNAFPKSVLAAC